MIKNNINGFGNDYYTEVLVHSKIFEDVSKNQRYITTNESTQSTTYHHFGDTSIFPNYDTSSLNSLFGCSGITIEENNFCFDTWLYVKSPIVVGVETSLFSFIPFILYDSDAGWNGNIPKTSIYLTVTYDSWTGTLDIKSGYNTGGTSIFEKNLIDLTSLTNKWFHIALIKSFGYGDDGYFISINGQRNLITDINYNHNLINKNYSTFLLQTLANLKVSFYLDEWRCSVGHPRWITDFNLPNRMY